MIKIVGMIALFGLLFDGPGQKTRPPNVPENLRAPVGEEVILLAHATGFQVYVCQAGADQKLMWVFKAPEANLLDTNGVTIGRHYAGPTWKHNDGSEVTGKVAAKQDAPDPDSIPWLLLNATGHFGNGILSRVTTIQRIRTKGGQPPQASTCEESKRGAETKSPYSADYYFYAAPAQ
jgi:Protein of unknown function (DUF3455)